MRLNVKFAVIAIVLTLALTVVASTPPTDPKPDVIKVCLCPYKSAALCAIYCGLY